MSQIKDKFFEVLVREESMCKYTVRANDQEQAERLFEQHKDFYHPHTRKFISQDSHIIDIGECNDPF